jgi:hypothetical protein
MQKKMDHNPDDTIETSHYEKSQEGFTEDFSQPESQSKIEKKEENINDYGNNGKRDRRGNGLRNLVNGFEFYQFKCCLAIVACSFQE